MTEEERAVWIGEKLFCRVFKKVKIEGLQSLVDDRQYRYVTPATNKEIAYFLCGSDDLLDLETFIKWLSSPDGVAVVKARMIERGYDYIIRYSYQEYSCLFLHTKNNFWRGEVFSSNTEPEAVVAACEKALRSEEV